MCFPVLVWFNLDDLQMSLFTGLDDPQLPRGGVLSIGNFDGVHRGHRQLIETLLRQADRQRTAAIVLTFDPPPSRILAPERSPPLLTTATQKGRLLLDCGVDAVIIYPTDVDLLNLTAQEFFQKIVLDQLGAVGLVEGPNFFFGKDRRGDIPLLQQLCRDHSRSLMVVEAEKMDGLFISSSEIRKALAQGEVSWAIEMLGRPYSMQGCVVEGSKRGRLLGFPTANLSGIQTMLPADGVYAATCLLDGRPHSAAVHIGPNPTFSEGERKVEVHVIDYTGDLYGTPLTIDFFDRIRGIRKFQSEAEIITQIEQDVLMAQALTH